MSSKLNDRRRMTIVRHAPVNSAVASSRARTIEPLGIAFGSVAIVVGLLFASLAAAQQAPAASPLPQSTPGTGPAGAAFSQSGGSVQQVGVDLPQATIRMLQQSLMQRGYAIRAADGIWGPETASAVREFQRVNGLQASGRPDARTMTALGVSTGETIRPSVRQTGSGQAPPEVKKRTPADLDTATIRAIQQALDRRGLQVGAVDGVWGERTTSAIGNLQRTLGLAASGEPNAHTLAALGLLPGSAARPDAVRAGKQPGAAELDPAAIRLIQQALSERGLGLGVDGVWGDRTAVALRDFQRAQGIEPLGEPDVHTLSALGILPSSDSRPASGSGTAR